MKITKKSISKLIYLLIGIMLIFLGWHLGYLYSPNNIIPPIIIPNIPIIEASRNIIFSICPSVPPILFNIAYSFFLSFIVIKNELYNIIINFTLLWGCLGVKSNFVNC